MYDSIPNSTLTEDIKRQIAAILFITDMKKITTNFINVQTQDNGADCGAHALAFATSLCIGDDPTVIRYISTELRPHLLSCLEKKVMAPFPQRTRRPRKLVIVSFCSKFVEISIFMLSYFGSGCVGPLFTCEHTHSHIPLTTTNVSKNAYN